MRALALLAAALLAALLLQGCVEGKSKSNNEGRLSAYILDSPPALAHTLNTNFDNRVRLLGYRLEPEGAVSPGQEVKLTLYWQVDEKVPAGYQLFTHVVNERGARFSAGNVDNVGPLRETSSGRQALPPSDWRRGKVYVDEQVFRIPADATPEISIVTGIWRGEGRLPIIGPGADGEQRAIVARLRTQGAVEKPRREPPVLRAVRLPAEVAAPVIDGKLDDPAWKRAAATGRLVDVTSGLPNTSFPVNATVKLTWDDANLYLAFEVEDDKLIGGLKAGERDQRLWEKECVEIMIDPDGDGDNRDYYEIQVSPQNLVFDSQFDEYNRPRGGNDGPFGHQDWAFKGQTAVQVLGTLDDDGDRDRGYVVEAKLSWASFDKAKQAPPRDGDSWRFNFYAMKRNGGVAWSPIFGEGNFHKASRFGRVYFAHPGSLPTGAPSR